MQKPGLVKTSTALFLVLLVLAMSQPARTQPGPDPVHPMDALTASEIEKAIGMLRDAGHTTTEARYPTLTLLENTKTDMWAWREGMPFSRRAFAIVMQDSRVFEAEINLTTGTVENWREVQGVQPRVLLEETDVNGLLWADSRWREAMAARSFDEDDAIFCTPLTPGPVLPPAYAGRRILYSTCFDVGDEELMTFGLPIEGLMGIVDVETREVLDVIDLGVVPRATDRPSLDYAQSMAYRQAMKPITIEAPQGSNIRIEGSVINWDNWRFHLRTDQRVGPVVSLVTFDDQGERRPVAYQIAVSEMFVPYMDPAATWSWKAYMDVGEYGFGLLSSTLQRGADCPASAHYLDQVVADDTGKPLVLRDSVCVFERPLGSPLWRHVGDTASESRPAVELVVRMAPVVGNYDYLIDYVFSKAGDIEVRAGAAGIDAVKAVAAQALAALTAQADTTHGNMIGRGLVGVNHDHFISFRIDMDVDGPANNAVFDRVVTEPLPSPGPRRSLWRVVEETIATEGALDHMEDGFLRIASGVRKNALGYATGYQLYSGHNAISVLAADDPLQVRAGWSSAPAWLTRHAQDELYASGNYPNQNSNVNGLAQWAAGGDSIENEDLVLWYTVGFRHITRAEDWPAMPTLWHSFRLRPFNFFDGSPVMDVVPE